MCIIKSVNCGFNGIIVRLHCSHSRGYTVRASTDGWISCRHIAGGLVAEGNLEDVHG